MRLIDADELIEHAWRDKLDSRELIAGMIEKAPTVKEISTNIPIDVFEKLVSQETKTGHWIGDKAYPICSKCNCNFMKEYIAYADYAEIYKPMIFCPNCGVKMIEPQESEVEECR